MTAHGTKDTPPQRLASRPAQTRFPSLTGYHVGKAILGTGIHGYRAGARLAKYAAGIRQPNGLLWVE